MPDGKEIKNRIKSVRNTKKITKAMELVAASKMKRAVSAALSSRLYATHSWQILTSIAEGQEISHPFFIQNGFQTEDGDTDENKTKKKKVLLVLIASNRGLCGSYNAQILKKTLVFFKSLEESESVEIIAVGKKGDQAMRRLGRNVLASFLELPEKVSLSDVAPIAELLISEYKTGRYSRVLIAYTDYLSAVLSIPRMRQMIPISREKLKEAIESIGEKAGGESGAGSPGVEYLFEGDRENFISSLAEKLVRMQIYQLFLESSASEQSSRMMAMKNATEAASEMVEELTLSFNKARQAGITREISEISAGMASVG